MSEPTFLMYIYNSHIDCWEPLYKSLYEMGDNPITFSKNFRIMKAFATVPSEDVYNLVKGLRLFKPVPYFVFPLHGPVDPKDINYDSIFILKEYDGNTYPTVSTKTLIEVINKVFFKSSK